MARLRFSSLSGVLDADIDGSNVTLSSPDFADLPAVASPDYLPLILDPDRAAGAPEIVYVTAHTAAATTVTVTRGREQAHGAPAGRSHASGVTWHHGPTAGEFIGDVHGLAHTDSANPIRLTAPVISVELDDDIEAITDGELNEIVLVLAQGSTGGTWTSHTGVLISWEAGAPPTLATTAGHYDVIRLIRAQSGVAAYIGRVEVADATIAFA